MKSSRFALHVLIAGLTAFLAFANTATAGSADKVAKAQAAIGAYLETHPKMVIDFSDVSGEYCVNTWKVGGGHMTHYAIDPSETTEDVIDFIKAESFMSSGIDMTALPTLPSTLGAMEGGQWYYLPKGAIEPHHGSQSFPIPLIVRATNIQ